MVAPVSTCEGRSNAAGDAFHPRHCFRPVQGLRGKKGITCLHKVNTNAATQDPQELPPTSEENVERCGDGSRKGRPSK